MVSSEFPQENGHPDRSRDGSVILTDESGRHLDCYVEHSLAIDDTEYLLLLPVDSPIEIVAWDEDDDEDVPTLLNYDDAEIDDIFSDAKAVLAEQNLMLKRTAYTLTAEGEIPPMDEEEVLASEPEDEDDELESEELQLLASFYHEEQEYGIYTPLDPVLFFAQRNKAGEAELLSPEEFERVQPVLEELLFEELD